MALLCTVGSISSRHECSSRCQMGCCNSESALSDQQQGVGSKGSVDRGWQGLVRGQVRRGPPAQVSPEPAVAFERDE